jgi:transposase
VTKHSKSQPKAKSPTISSEPTEAVAPKRGSRKVSVTASDAPKEAPRNKPAFRPVAPKVGSGKVPGVAKQASRKERISSSAAPRQAPHQKSIAASDAPRQAPRKERLSTLPAPKEAPHKGPASKSPGWFTIGLDLGDRSNTFCVLDDDGAVVAEGKVKTTRAALDQQFANLAPARVALEAGTHSGWISRLIESYGHEVIVANPREVRKIYQNDRKNDRSDAQILARLARFDPQLLEPIRHRGAQMQADLATIRARETLVTARTKCVNAMRGLVKSMGARLPKCSTESFCKRVGADIPAELEAAFRPLVATIQTLNEQIRYCDKQIEALATETYPQTALLQQVSGVGALTALAFVLTIADGTRFGKSRELGAYLGLVPRQDDSGDRTSQLRITKAGDPYLRRLLVGSAQYIVGPFGPDTDLRRYGERLTQRGGKNGKKRAIVAVARKLAVLLHRLWTTGEAYEPLRNSKHQASTKAA